MPIEKLKFECSATNLTLKTSVKMSEEAAFEIRLLHGDKPPSAKPVVNHFPSNPILPIANLDNPITLWFLWQGRLEEDISESITSTSHQNDAENWEEFA